jgi:hypothetical protein
VPNSFDYELITCSTTPKDWRFELLKGIQAVERIDVAKPHTFTTIQNG